MVGSRLPLLWVAIGAPILFFVLLGILKLRMRKLRAEEERRAAEERLLLEERIDDVTKVAPLAIPPSLQAPLSSQWARYTPERFSRRARARNRTNGTE